MQITKRIKAIWRPKAQRLELALQTDQHNDTIRSMSLSEIETLYSFLGDVLEKEDEVTKLKRKIDEIMWGKHIDEGYAACNCEHCARYRKWIGA